MSKGQLWIVAAPSGGGKTSLIAEMVRRLPRVIESISHTTRLPRPNEIEGVHYFFITPDEFKEKIAKNEFLEYAEVFGNFYGTSGVQIDEWLEAGNDVILNIDWQGAEQVMNCRPDTRTVFLLPPSLSVLEKRLRGRAQDKDEVIAKRMAEAPEQISHYRAFEYLIVNDDFATACYELESILLAARLKQERSACDLQDLLASLGQK